MHFRIITQETTMAKKAVAKKSVAKKTAAKKSVAKKTATNRTLDPTLNIVPVAGAENPIREGTAAFKRVQTVLKSKRVELALAAGARTSTIRFAVKAGLIKLAS